MEKSELIEVLIAMKEARMEQAKHYEHNLRISKIEVDLVDSEIDALRAILN